MAHASLESSTGSRAPASHTQPALGASHGPSTLASSIPASPMALASPTAPVCPARSAPHALQGPPTLASMSAPSAADLQTCKTHAATIVHFGAVPPAAYSTPGAMSSSEFPSKPAVATSHYHAATRLQPQTQAESGSPPTATSSRVADLISQSPDLVQAGVQPPLPGPPQTPAPSPTVQGRTQHTREEPPSGHTSMARGVTVGAPPDPRVQPQSAAQGGEAVDVEAHQSTAAAFLDDMLTQADRGCLFKGRAHMHRPAAGSPQAQPAAVAPDRHVCTANFTDWSRHTCLALMVFGRLQHACSARICSCKYNIRLAVSEDRTDAHHGDVNHTCCLACVTISTRKLCFM